MDRPLVFYSVFFNFVDLGFSPIQQDVSHDPMTTPYSRKNSEAHSQGWEPMGHV